MTTDFPPPGGGGDGDGGSGGGGEGGGGTGGGIDGIVSMLTRARRRLTSTAERAAQGNVPFGNAPRTAAVDSPSGDRRRSRRDTVLGAD